MDSAPNFIGCGARWRDLRPLPEEGDRDGREALLNAGSEAEQGLHATPEAKLWLTVVLRGCRSAEGLDRVALEEPRVRRDAAPRANPELGENS